MDNIRLVELCKSGNREAFGLLYENYLPVMREVVAYYIHNSDAVWDVIHDGFIVAFTSISTLRNGAKVESWLTTIIKKPFAPISERRVKTHICSYGRYCEFGLSQNKQ